MNPPRPRSGTQPRSSPPTDRPSRPRSLRRAGLFFAFPREDVEPGTETRPSCRARVACPAIVILLGLSVGQAQSAARVISAQSRRGAVALAQADPKGSSGVGTALANPGAAKAPRPANPTTSSRNRIARPNPGSEASATSVAQAGSLAQVGLDQNRLAFELGRMPRLRWEVEHTPWPEWMRSLLGLKNARPGEHLHELLVWMAVLWSCRARRDTNHDE